MGTKGFFSQCFWGELWQYLKKSLLHCSQKATSEEAPLWEKNLFVQKITWRKGKGRSKRKRRSEEYHELAGQKCVINRSSLTESLIKFVITLLVKGRGGNI